VRFGIPQISTGDTLRAARREGTPLGKKAEEYMNKGALVPDEVVIGLVEERLGKPDAKAGFILDGFPRTIPQAEALDAKLDELGRAVTSVLLIDVSDDEVVRRLGGRRTCEENGHVFHVEFNPPKQDGACDLDGSALVVRDDDKLKERVNFIHRQNETPAIAEEYIEGREIYVGVIGNQRLQAFTPWELVMRNLPEGSANIATGKVKWDIEYQKKVGLVTKPADLSEQTEKEFKRLSKRVYRILGLSGYARIDYRLTEAGRIYLLEVNPNPQIAHNEDFADSAEHCGVTYEALLQKILTLGMSYDPMR